MVDGVNTMTAKLQLVQGADKLHQPPATAGEVSDHVLQVFYDAQSARAYADWPKPDLFNLLQMARLQVLLVESMARLEKAGPLVLGGKNFATPVENPLIRVCATLGSNISTLARLLGMTYTAVDPRSTKQRAEIARNAQTVEEEPSLDGRVSDSDLMN